jgi:hypothetical protein
VREETRRINVTRETALSLLQQYGVHLRDRYDRDGMAADSPPSGLGPYDHIVAEADMRFPADGAEDKAMRWLGFVQGALYVKGIFTLEQLKEHSRTGEVA